MKPKKEGKLSRMVSWFEKKVCACTPAERPKLVRKTKPKKVREELASYQDFNKAQMAATEGQWPRIDWYSQQAERSSISNAKIKTDRITQYFI